MFPNQAYVDAFVQAARQVGSLVESCADLGAAITYISGKVEGELLLPVFASGQRLNLAERLREAGITVVTENLRAVAAQATAGLTGANFALADTGTLVLESTAEDVRLAGTLPALHFVLLDPEKILADGCAAVPLLRALHQRDPRNYIAQITGPSRTADIERVLTIGVHGPVELHILLLPGMSNDPLEM